MELIETTVAMLVFGIAVCMSLASQHRVRALVPVPVRVREVRKAGRPR